MSAIRTRLAGLIATLSFAIAGPAVAAQSVAAETALPGRCANSARVPAATDQARIAAQEIAGRAQAASINGDNVAATKLYRRAATLDPTDPGIAYALGREYETVRDPRSMAEFCRYLALSPRSPEAADVRQRIAALAFALPPDTTVVRIPVATSTGMPAPGAALVSGLIIPGLGQFITHAPTMGLLVMAATAGSAFYGLQTRNVTSQVTHTAIDPLGHTYQYQTTETRSERPNMAVGLGVATAISIVAAVSAFVHARGYRTPATASVRSSDGDSRGIGSVTPLITVAPRSIGLGLSLQ